jgi:hypothetical protein
MQQSQPFIHTAADDKLSQGTTAVAEILAFQQNHRAWASMHRWTSDIKTGVARILSNRTAFNAKGASPAEDQQFGQLMAKVKRCMNTDTRVSAYVSTVLLPCLVC